MKRAWISLVLGASLVLGVLHGQTLSSNVVVKIDPAIDNIVSSNAKIEKLLDGHGVFEGPIWVHKVKPQYLVLTDITSDGVQKWTPDGKVSVIIDHVFSGVGTPQLVNSPVDGKKPPMIGANGTTLDRDGRIVFCALGDRAILRVEKDGGRTVLANRFEGKKFNLPNDLVYRSDGSLYFTDSQADLKRQESDPEKGIPFTGVYLLKNGSLQVLAKDFTLPNGLALSPDEKYLYVNDSLKKTITRFDVQPDDSVSNPKLLIDMNNDKAEGLPDGMKVDKAGNVYCTGPGGLWIISSDGKHIGTILTPQRLTNFAFGDKDGKTLYMTAPQALYRIRLKIDGVRP